MMYFFRFKNSPNQLSHNCDLAFLGGLKIKTKIQTNASVALSRIIHSQNETLFE